jgi:hypothetical protein
VRTTLKLDDDVLEAAKSLAEAERRTLGEVISDLARRGLQPRPCREMRDGFPVFDVGAGAPPITLDKVRAALEEP